MQKAYRPRDFTGWYSLPLLFMLIQTSQLTQWSSRRSLSQFSGWRIEDNQRKRKVMGLDLFQGRDAIAWFDTASSTRLPPLANTSVLTTATLRPFCSTVEFDRSALPWPGLMNQALAAVSKG